MVDESSRQWHDNQISQLYKVGMSSPSVTIRREVMKILGARKRVGCEEAAIALDDIKKKYNQD